MAVQTPSRLYRSRSQKMLAGVCAGLGDYFDIDPVLVRLLFIVTSLISGVGILAYAVLWLLVPYEGDESPRIDLDAIRAAVERLGARARDLIDPPARRDGPTAQTPR